MFFSVIVPVYNVEPYLKECIYSVLNQNFRDYELILVDDGSPDKCPDMCDEAGRKFENVKVIHKKNGGLSDARNTGLQIASGEYVIFLDSDDYWNDYNFLLKISKIIPQKQPDVIFFGYKKVMDNSILSCYIPICTCEKIAESARIGIFRCCSWDKVIKRDLLIRNEIFFRKNVYSEDMEWCARIYKSADIVEVLREMPYSYRQREGSITKSISEKNIRDVKDGFERCVNLISEMGIEKRDAYDYFLAQNLSMFMVVLATINPDKRSQYYPFIKNNINYLHKYARSREKVIFYAVKLLGIPMTEKLLSIVWAFKENIRANKERN